MGERCYVGPAEPLYELASDSDAGGDAVKTENDTYGLAWDFHNVWLGYASRHHREHHHALLLSEKTPTKAGVYARRGEKGRDQGR